MGRGNGAVWVRTTRWVEVVGKGAGVYEVVGKGAGVYRRDNITAFIPRKVDGADGQAAAKHIHHLHREV